MANFTKPQLEMIDTVRTNLIVSAGAGSGKSTTLTERIIKIIQGFKNSKGVDIESISVNNILVVTFTNAAALEIKTKIREALTENKMYDELTKLDSSYVCTFDSLALSIVKKYAYKEKIDNNISITDDSFIKVKTNEFARNVLDDYYTKKDIDFLDMISNTCVKNDESIMDVVIRLNSVLDSKVDKEDYLNNYENNYFNDEVINDNIKTYEHVLMEKLKGLINSYQYALDQLDDTIYPITSNNIIDHINNLKNIKTYNQFYDQYILNNKTIALKSRKEPKYEEDIQKIFDEISRNFKKYKDKYIYPTLDEYYEDVMNILPYSRVIINLVRELNERITVYKKENNLYTFNDIARKCIKILKKYEEVRIELQNKFKEIMIDEYQDTNDIQEEMIKLISGNNHNVCVVGDIKQSIYGFRNANPTIFKKKYDEYSLINTEFGKKIDLIENFRSRKEVVDAVNKIFSTCMSDKIGKADYKKDHMMKFGNTTYENPLYKANQDYEAEVINYIEALDEVRKNEIELTKAELEAFIIGNDILNKINNNYQIFNFKEKNNGVLVGLRPCQFKDFCILTETTSNYETYKKIFEFLGIPLNVLKNDNLTDNEGIIVFKNLLKLIYNIYSNNKSEYELRYLYTSICRSFLYRLSDKEIFDTVSKNKILESELYKKCLSFSNTINVLTLENVILNIINDFDFIKKYNTLDNINSGLVLSEYLVNSAKSFSDLSYDLLDYISYISSVIEQGIKLEVDAGGKTSDAVQLMTIHKSKGLEYQIVYYSDLYKAFNRSDVKGKFLFSNRLGIINPYHKEKGLDEIFYKDLNKYYYDLDLISEKIRLFYVAITRAKEKVIIVDAFDKNRIDYSFNEYDEYSLLKVKSFSSLMSKIYSKFTNIKECSLSDINIDTNYKIISINKKLVYSNDVKTIEVKALELNDQIDDSKISYSKKSYKIKDNTELERLEFGEMIHYILECLDFKDINILNTIDKLNLNIYYKNKLKAFINCDLMKNVRDSIVYKEYHFINKGSIGIIDLMLEYNDHIDIIDYKLKNIDDEAYVNQLTGYKNYISTISNKVINIYLYSILDEKYKNI